MLSQGVAFMLIYSSPGPWPKRHTGLCQGLRVLEGEVLQPRLAERGVPLVEHKPQAGFDVRPSSH